MAHAGHEATVTQDEGCQATKNVARPVNECCATLHAVQHLTLPDGQFGAGGEMYWRARNAGVTGTPPETRLAFEKGGMATFDTFFNALTIHTWKKRGHLQDLHLVLHGRGRFCVRLGVHRLNGASSWIGEQIVGLDGETSVEVEAWPTLEDGLLYFSLEALEQAVIEGGRFATTTQPADLKLGIVITHFNRKHYVLPAIRRIRDDLMNDDRYRGKIALVVVDNSQNITAQEAAGITLLPNANLGGSGGFARGLLHLMDDGSFTHCLFMDDDASCEIKSIRRAYDFLRFTAPDANVAVASSLLREQAPNVLSEKGAWFNGARKSIGNGLDMGNVHDLLVAEAGTARPDYGGWWFFAFPLAGVRHFPFPFFVRGDDILFSLQNQFDIVTMNGIGCWGEDFQAKEGPLIRYFSYRATILLLIMTGRASRRAVLRQFANSCLASLFCCRYASASVICQGMQDVLKGPQFFIDNVDATEIRRWIGEIADAETVRPITLAHDLVDQPDTGMERRAHAILRGLTLNGFLLPDFLLKNRTIFQPKTSRPVLRQIFRYRRIYYGCESGNQGYIVEHDKKKFFAGLARFFIGCWAVVTQLGRAKKACVGRMDYLTSQAFWRKIYSDGN